VSPDPAAPHGTNYTPPSDSAEYDPEMGHGKPEHRQTETPSSVITDPPPAEAVPVAVDLLDDYGEQAPLSAPGSSEKGGAINELD
jgi:hypothetical protein